MSKKKTTLLVVDTEPQTRKMLESVLDRSDFKVEECLTGKQTTKLAMSLKPDLVLSDLNLPDMQGNEVITSLRAWSQAPIIILSARQPPKISQRRSGKALLRVAKWIVELT
jgi:two-component system, OmpR family, KDP operon response regulator KdpE